MKKGEIWCLAGLPGAGKTTLAKNLTAASKDFCHCETDREIARTGSDTTKKLVALRSSAKRIASYISELRQSVAAVYEFAEMERHPADKHFLPLLEVLNDPDTDDDFLIATIADTMVLVKFYALLGRRRTFEKGAGAAREGKIALLDCPEFMSQRERIFTRRYLLEKHNLEPGIIICQTSQDKLLAVARERERTEGNSLQRDQQRVRMMMEYADPYGPEECFKQVLVLNDETVRRSDYVRNLIARAIENFESVKKPIPLVI